MKLTYRGTDYNYNPAVTNLADRTTQLRQHQTVERKALGTVLRYRGTTYQVQPTTATAPATVPANVKLLYRGVAYNNQPMAQPLTAPQVNQPTPSIDAQARALTANHHRQIKQREQAMLSRLATWAGLSANQPLFWNHIGGGSHPSFRATYDRQGATLS